MPLPDPATYIRLLTATPTTNGELSSFFISTWSFNEAPKYNAISYAWGEPNATSILINGCPLRVRQNCHDALVQAHRFEPTAFLWVDSVCINQNDPKEKSHQVERMYAVYSYARNVLACVGDHHENSELFFDLHSDFLDASETLEPPEQFSDTWREKIEELLYQSREPAMMISIAQFLDSYLAFSNRSYWNRLWIVQEIVAGADRTIPIEEKVVRNPLESLLDFILNINNQTRKIQLSSACEFLPGTDCQDPRDRIYGLLGQTSLRLYHAGDRTRDIL